MEAHTKAKHLILKTYLDAWFPIMLHSNKKIIFIDGFAGPGIYEDGEDGSPRIAFNTLFQHSASIKGEVLFVFFEKDKQRFASLKEVGKKIRSDISSKPKADLQIDIKPINVSFEEGIIDFLHKEEPQIPVLAFIDPFGFSGIPMELIRELAKREKCELLINFMTSYIHRFKGVDKVANSLESLFGLSDWEEQRLQLKKIDDLLEIYQDQLKKKTGVQFTRQFEMVTLNNNSGYHLIYATKNELGLRKIKEAMWKVDPELGKRFSDREATQTKLFESTPNYGVLRKQIYERFKGKEVGIREIDKFVTIETDFLTTHIRQGALMPLEENGMLEVRNRNRKNTYPENCLIIFK